ncbi:MAG: hypothetical protein K1X28_01655 [Parachlamydiales bacterium]|nr:hypothetical protein [Parachlamydiales bacterium]
MEVPPVARSYWSYLNPLNLVYVPGKIWSAVSFIFSRNEPLPAIEMQRRIIVLRGVGDGVLQEEDHKSVSELLDESTRPYSSVIVVLKDGSKLEVAKTFLTDAERSGRDGMPDQIVIDGVEIKPPPRTDEQKLVLLERLLEIAGGDRSKVTRWTQLCNFRLKASIGDLVLQDYKKKYGTNALIRQDLMGKANDYHKVVVSLDTKKGALSCEVEGVIRFDNNDDGDIREVDVPFKGLFKYEIDEEGQEWVLRDVDLSSRKQA